MRTTTNSKVQLGQFSKTLSPKNLMEINTFQKHCSWADTEYSSTKDTQENYNVPAKAGEQVQEGGCTAER